MTKNSHCPGNLARKTRFCFSPIKGYGYGRRFNSAGIGGEDRDMYISRAKVKRAKWNEVSSRFDTMGTILLSRWLC